MRTVHIVAALPKTRSRKILRSSLRAIANGHEVKIPNTIEIPESIVAILSGWENANS